MTLTDTATSDHPTLAKRRRYRRLMFAAILFGSLGLMGAARFDRHVLGVGVYWAGVLAFVAIWRGTSVELFDERDLALERRASLATLQVAAVIGIVAIPAAVTLERLGYLELPPVAVGGIYGYASLFVVFGVIYVLMRYWP